MQKRFEEVSRQILMGLWEEEPVEATYLGIHNFDHILARTDSHSRNAYTEQKEHFLTILKEFQERKQELTPEQRIDLDILVSNISSKLHSEENLALWSRRADLYPQEALYGVYLLIIRDSLPEEERNNCILSRLKEIPRLLDEGVKNLGSGENIPRVWTEIGIDMTRSGKAFFQGIVPEISRRAGRIRRKMEMANKEAVQALQEFDDFLQFVIKPRSDGNFALGEEHFNFMLTSGHALPLDAEELMNIGRDAVISTTSQLEETAKLINKEVGWKEQLANLKADHPNSENLLSSYVEWMEKARKFVEERDLVSIPENQDLEVVETPQFQRSTIPYAAFIPPAPFEKKQQGIFWVTPVNDSASDETQEEQLQGHNSWGIPVTSLHEAYPGHHLQLCHANRVNSMVRRQMYSTVFIEGWALYCEEMMLAQGFLNSPKHKLMQLKDQLWRACRVVIDVGIHCFEMTFDEAVEMLVEIAGLERSNAVAEVNRYTQSPTQPMSYLVGKIEITRLKERYQAAEGENFNLKEFHDRLLGYGSIPPGIIERDMIG